MRCPRGPADGSYVVRKRGCQNAKYDNKEDCKENGWHWWEPVTAATRFALHDELELVVHDASQLRSNLEANKPAPVADNQPVVVQSKGLGALEIYSSVNAPPISHSISKKTSL